MRRKDIIVEGLRYGLGLLIFCAGLISIVGTGGGGGGTEPTTTTPPPPPAETSAVIGPEGGILLVTNPSNQIYGTSIEIPQNALTKECKFTLQIEEESIEPENKLFVGIPIRISMDECSDISTLNVPAIITLKYEPSLIPENATVDSLFVFKGEPGGEPDRLRAGNILSIDNNNHTIKLKIDSFSYLVAGANQSTSIDGQYLSPDDCENYSMIIDYLESLDLESNQQFFDKLTDQVKLEKSLINDILELGPNVLELTENKIAFKIATGMEAGLFAKKAAEAGQLLKKSNKTDEDSLELALAFIDGMKIFSAPASLPVLLLIDLGKLFVDSALMLVGDIVIAFHSVYDYNKMSLLFGLLDLQECGIIAGQFPETYNINSSWGSENPKFFKKLVKGQKDESDGTYLRFNLFKNYGYRAVSLSPGFLTLPAVLKEFENEPYIAIGIIDNICAFDKKPGISTLWQNHWNVDGILASLEFGSGVPIVRGFVAPFLPDCTMPAFFLSHLHDKPNQLIMSLDLFNNTEYYDYCDNITINESCPVTTTTTTTAPVSTSIITTTTISPSSSTTSTIRPPTTTTSTSSSTTSSTSSITTTSTTTTTVPGSNTLRLSGIVRHCWGGSIPANNKYRVGLFDGSPSSSPVPFASVPVVDGTYSNLNYTHVEGPYPNLSLYVWEDDWPDGRFGNYTVCDQYGGCTYYYEEAYYGMVNFSWNSTQVQWNSSGVGFCVAFSNPSQNTFTVDFRTTSSDCNCIPIYY